jgi:hypothetical protein
MDRVFGWFFRGFNRVPSARLEPMAAACAVVWRARA